MMRERRPACRRARCQHAGDGWLRSPVGIRDAGWPVKVIMLTARQHERDVLRGFELGADDYVVKPFNPLELAARLKRLV